MQKKSLVELLHDLEQEMLRIGYAASSLAFYRRRWHMLRQFAQEQGEAFYSEQLGIDFVEKHFHILEKDFNRNLSRSEITELRIIRMIGDFQLHHAILRQHYKYKEILTDPYFIAISNRFESYCLDKSYSKGTIGNCVTQSARFMDYLAFQNIKHCKGISLELIHAYIKTLAGYTYRTVEQNIFSLRVFFRFLLTIGEVETDFSTKMPKVQVRKQTRIPSMWTADELKKLIAAIDRGGAARQTGLCHNPAGLLLRHALFRY